MRLLHTSDWHIGRSLHGTELLADQEAVLGSLAAVVAAESVDVVVVAGDIYDRAVPSADAQAVLDRAVGRLLSAGAPVRRPPGVARPRGRRPAVARPPRRPPPGQSRLRPPARDVLQAARAGGAPRPG